jgi:hypothetical protein
MQMRSSLRLYRLANVSCSLSAVRPDMTNHPRSHGEVRGVTDLYDAKSRRCLLERGCASKWPKSVQFVSSEYDVTMN